MTVATLHLVNEVEVVDVGSRSIAADADRIVVAVELEHGQAMFGFIRRQGLSDDEAQDAVQETLLRVWRELLGGAAIENPRAWAYRALYRLAMDQHRLRRQP